MTRTTLNSLSWALMISLFPFSYSYWIFDSYIGLIMVPIFYLAVKIQPYIFYKNGCYYFRNKPFKKAQNIIDIENIDELEIIFESHQNTILIWEKIKKAQLSYQHRKPQ